MYKRILIIDDDIDDQMILEAAIKLIDTNYECSFASNGREAVEHIENFLPYDIVLIDLNMPLMNGFDTIKTIRQLKLYNEVPLIVISTSNSTYDINRAKRLGASLYIIKPDTFLELIEKLKYAFNIKI